MPIRDFDDIDWDESSFQEAAELVLKLNPEPMKRFGIQTVDDLIADMKWETLKNISPEKTSAFLGTAGWYVTAFRKNYRADRQWYATATLMPYMVKQALKYVHVSFERA